MQYVACFQVGQSDVKTLINLEGFRREVVEHARWSACPPSAMI